ncbi:MAG: Rod binding domain-containing protein [Candidatus Pelagisphaera sp.]|jgi:Rod binding domain-containing protein
MDPMTTGISAFETGKWSQSLQSSKLNETAKIDQAAKQFEGILMRQFLDEALKTMDGEGGLLGSSVPMYDHLIKDTLANSITQGASFGLSSILQAQLGGEPDGEVQKTDKK